MAVEATLLSVVTGGLAGAVLTHLFTRTRERNKTTDEEAAAHTVVQLELANANVGAKRVLDGDAWTKFPIKAWEDERSDLARGLPRQAFLVLAGAYNCIHGFNWRVDAGVFEDTVTGKETLVRS